MRDAGLQLTWLARCRILVVEDSVQMRQMLRSMLRTLGASEIVEAADGAAAMVELARRTPDLVILDHGLPGISGLELLAHLRNPDADRVRVPVIMITGHVSSRLIAAARDGGVSEIMCKPVSLASLAEKVEAAIWAPRCFVESGPYFGLDRRRREIPLTHLERRDPARETLTA